jgi:small multidrug resistance family-3 protein
MCTKSRLQPDTIKTGGREFDSKKHWSVFFTALAEISGCFLPYLWLRKGCSVWLLVPAAGSLALFVWLLTLHPTASGRVYADYGGIYVTTAFVWLRVVDGVKLSAQDLVGACIALLIMSIIVMG